MWYGLDTSQTELCLYFIYIYSQVDEDSLNSQKLCPGRLENYWPTKDEKKRKGW